MPPSLKEWGITPGETLLRYPCDPYMETPDDVCYRGVTIHADPEIVFQWICQMKAAPYSYDWIDNLGRKSPQHLIPGLDRLETGQAVMFIFDLIDFERNAHLTVRLKKKLEKFLGDAVISYRIFPKSHDACRLIVKILVRYPDGLSGMILKRILPLGDLIMMRRQLLNFKKLSEQTQTGG